MGCFRLFLAVAVLVAHFPVIPGLTILDGWIAVQTFFVISGFYIALIWNDKYALTDSPLWLFWTNRFLRLYPIYWVVLFLSVLVVVNLTSAGWRMPPAGAPELSATTFFWVFVSELTLIGTDIVVALGYTPDGTIQWLPNEIDAWKHWLGWLMFNPPAWSVSLEIWFYLVAPFLLGRKRLIVGLAIVSFTARWLAFHWGYIHTPFNFRFFPFELHHFLSGACAFYIYDAARRRWPNFELPICIPLLVSAIVIAYTAVYPSLPWTSLGGFYLKQWAFLAFVPFAVPVLFHATRNLGVDRYIGDLSYPLYIGHTLAALVCVHLFGVSPEWKNIAACGSAIVLAILLSEFQRQIDRYRAQRISVDAARKRVAFADPPILADGVQLK